MCTRRHAHSTTTSTTTMQNYKSHSPVRVALPRCTRCTLLYTEESYSFADKGREEERDNTNNMYMRVCVRGHFFSLHLVAHGKDGGSNARRVWNSTAQRGQEAALQRAPRPARAHSHDTTGAQPPMITQLGCPCNQRPRRRGDKPQPNAEERTRKNPRALSSKDTSHATTPRRCMRRSRPGTRARRYNDIRRTTPVMQVETLRNQRDKQHRTYSQGQQTRSAAHRSSTAKGRTPPGASRRCTQPTAPARQARGSGHPPGLDESSPDDEDSEGGNDEAILPTSSGSSRAKGNALKRTMVREE